MSGDSGVSVSVSQRSPSSGSGSMTIGGIGGGPFMVKYFLLYIDVFIVISYRKMSGKIFYFEWMNEWMLYLQESINTLWQAKLCTKHDK